MAVYDLFSKRQKALRGEVSDVYQYDELPEKLRVQICHILNDILSLNPNNIEYRWKAEQNFRFIIKQLNREYGRTQLVGGNYANDNVTTLFHFISTEKNVEKCLDAIELVFGIFTKCFDNAEFGWSEEILESKFTDLIDELNFRFKENSVGYQFINGQIIRVDSEFVHQQAVKPALNLLNNKDYSGANTEFLAAFEHYKNGKYAETLNDCLKSLESTMKIICTKHHWSFDKNDASKKLIDICLKNGLIPSFWQNNMSHLQALLESGVPTGRNKLAGHGQGNNPIEIPDYIASYILHMTASTIVFLINAEKAIGT